MLRRLGSPPVTTKDVMLPAGDGRVAAFLGVRRVYKKMAPKTDRQAITT